MKNAYKPTAVLLLVLLTTLGGCLAERQPPRQLITWTTLSEAKKLQGRTGKPILIDFFAGVQCLRCRHFEQTLYTDPAVARAINGRFIPVRIYTYDRHTEDEERIIDAVSPDRECVLAFLDHNFSLVKTADNEYLSSQENLSRERYLWYVNKAAELLHLPPAQ